MQRILNQLIIRYSVFNINEDAKSYGMNRFDDLQTPTDLSQRLIPHVQSQKTLHKNIVERSKSKLQLNVQNQQLSKMNEVSTQYQSDIRKEKDEKQKMKEELTKCQADLKKEIEEKQKINEELTKCQAGLKKEIEEKLKINQENLSLKETLKQKQIEIDQLMRRNADFAQVIKKVQEDISLVCEKEVKVFVKNI